MKKIILIFILSLILISCGKKGDPIYKENDKKVEYKSPIIIKTNEI